MLPDVALGGDLAHLPLGQLGAGLLGTGLLFLLGQRLVQAGHLLLVASELRRALDSFGLALEAF